MPSAGHFISSKLEIKWRPLSIYSIDLGLSYNHVTNLRAQIIHSNVLSLRNTW